jgi:hypothetical protein
MPRNLKQSPRHRFPQRKSQLVPDCSSGRHAASHPFRQKSGDDDPPLGTPASGRDAVEKPIENFLNLTRPQLSGRSLNWSLSAELGMGPHQPLSCVSLAVPRILRRSDHSGQSLCPAALLGREPNATFVSRFRNYPIKCTAGLFSFGVHALDNMAESTFWEALSNRALKFIQ